MADKTGTGTAYGHKPGGGLVPLYAVTIHHCIAKGDLQEMKDLIAKAEEHLHEYGNVPAALEALKVEVAKLEYK